MKKVEAVIREDALTPLVKELRKAGFTQITSYLVRGSGRQGGIRYRWAEGVEAYDLLPRVKVEIVVPDDQARRVVELIVKAVRRGVPGDGKIFITPVEEVIRVRTGERGDKALK